MKNALSQTKTFAFEDRNSNNRVITTMDNGLRLTAQPLLPSIVMFFTRTGFTTFDPMRIPVVLQYNIFVPDFKVTCKNNGMAISTPPQRYSFIALCKSPISVTHIPHLLPGLLVSWSTKLTLPDISRSVGGSTQEKKAAVLPLWKQGAWGCWEAEARRLPLWKCPVSYLQATCKQ